ELDARISEGVILFDEFLATLVNVFHKEHMHHKRKYQRSKLQMTPEERKEFKYMTELFFGDRIYIFRDSDYVEDFVFKRQNITKQTVRYAIMQCKDNVMTYIRALPSMET